MNDEASAQYRKRTQFPTFCNFHPRHDTDRENASPFCISVMHQAFHRSCSSTTCRVTRRLGVHQPLLYQLDSVPPRSSRSSRRIVTPQAQVLGNGYKYEADTGGIQERATECKEVAVEGHFLCTPYSSTRQTMIGLHFVALSLTP